MAKKHTNIGPPVHITPRQQLAKLITTKQLPPVDKLLEGLDPQAQEDILIALVAFRRFGFKRPFADKAMQERFDKGVDVVGSEPRTTNELQAGTELQSVTPKKTIQKNNPKNNL